ncbi:MAG: DUF2510 domain-containing protein [Frankiaceae bacterium]
MSCGAQLISGQTYCTSCGAPALAAAGATAPPDPGGVASHADTVGFGFGPQPAGAAAAPAGWYDDGAGQLRYWDGARWTDHVAPAAAPHEQRPAGGANPWPLVLIVLGVLGAGVVAVVAFLVVTRGGDGSPAATGPTVTQTTAGSQPTSPSPGVSTAPMTPSTPPTPSRSVVGSVDYSTVASIPAAADVATSFSTYFDGINARRYGDAFAVLSPGYRSRGNLTVDRWSAGLQTTVDTQVRLTGLQATAAGARATVAFTSRQAPKDGYRHQTCTHWIIDYTLSPASTTNPPYVIDTVQHRSIRAC